MEVLPPPSPLLKQEGEQSDSNSPLLKQEEMMSDGNSPLLDKEGVGGGRLDWTNSPHASSHPSIAFSIRR